MQIVEHRLKSVDACQVLVAQVAGPPPSLPDTYWRAWEGGRAEEKRGKTSRVP